MFGEQQTRSGRGLVCLCSFSLCRQHGCHPFPFPTAHPLFCCLCGVPSLHRLRGCWAGGQFHNGWRCQLMWCVMWTANTSCQSTAVCNFFEQVLCFCTLNALDVLTLANTHLVNSQQIRMDEHHQKLQLLGETNTGFPTDIWLLVFQFVPFYTLPNCSRLCTNADHAIVQTVICTLSHFASFSAQVPSII